MSENRRKRSKVPVDCVAPETEMAVRIAANTEIGLEDPASMDRVVLHIGGLESTNSLILHMTGRELVRVYTALGQAMVQIMPRDTALALVGEACAVNHLWKVEDVSHAFRHVYGGAQ